MQRRATAAIALTLGSLVAPDALDAQTRTVNPNAPRLLVVVFSSNSRPVGVEVADEVRERILRAVNARNLTVIAKDQIVGFLQSSGYNPDSSLGQIDLEALAKAMRADEVIGGHVTKTGENLKVEPRFMLARDVSIAQPLGAHEGDNPGRIARDVERAYQEAHKQLEDNQDCENGIRDRQFDKAIVAARKAIAAYPQATIARLCMASAYQAKSASEQGAAQQASLDSLIRIAEEVRRMDPRSSLALRLAYAGYQARNDAENSIRSLMALLELEPNNPTLTQQVVTALAQLGKPEVALPIVDTLLLRTPGDPTLLRHKWLLTLAAAAADTVPASKSQWFEKAIVAGQNMVRGDTAAADTTFFERQIAASMGITDNPARAVEVTSRATQKFPRNATFWALKAQAERKAGQLQMADQSIRQALSIDPKAPNGMLLLGTIEMELGRLDSALVVARRAVAAGEDAKTWGTFLLAPTQTVYKHADSVKTVPEYQRALGFAQASDSLAPSATAKFFIGVTSLNVAIASLQDAQKAKSCQLAKQAQDMFLLTQMNMPGGGSVDPATAQTVLGYAMQYSPTADQMAKQYCK